MFELSSLTANQLCANRSVKNQFDYSRGNPATISLSLLVIVIISMSFSRSGVTSAQTPPSVTAATEPSQLRAAIPVVPAGRLKSEVKARSATQFSLGDGASVIPSDQSVCGWTSGSVFPFPVQDQAMASVGNTLYSFGGIGNGEIVPSYKFDGTRWTEIARLPYETTLASAVSDGTSVYIMNGIIGDLTGNAVIYNNLYRYDPATNAYTELAPSPTGTWSQAAAYLNGKIYKIGGRPDLLYFSNKVEVYDIASDTWTTAADYPRNTGYLSAFAVNGFLYGAGGTTDTFFDLVKTYRYSPASNTWDDTAIADMPTPRWGAASTIYRGQPTLAGGYVATPLPIVSNTVIQWNPATNTWTYLPNLIEPRTRTAGAVADGSFDVVGGTLLPKGEESNSNQRLFCPDPTLPIVQGVVNYVSDNGTPLNNAPDPGETVTVSLNLQNIGVVGTGNSVTVALQATGGIINPSAAQNYGTLTPGGAAVARNFTFQVPANATCSNEITLTFVVTDGANTTRLSKVYRLGTLQSAFRENFDGVAAPALPTGWSSTQTGGNPGWMTSTNNSDSAPNSVFSPDLASAGSGSGNLISPAFNIASPTATLDFKLRYNTEFPSSGGDLEISIDGGQFQDIVAAGGSFVSGGYNDFIYAFDNPLGVYPGWTGSSNGYVNVSAQLPPAANGRSVRFRWRNGHDGGFAPSGGGINVDSVIINSIPICSTVASSGTTNNRGDFDGDGRSDIAVFRPATNIWYQTLSSNNAFSTYMFGASGDRIAPADYDGDGKADVAVFRPATGTWYLLRSTAGFAAQAFGQMGDVPVPADYDGDGKSDLAMFRPSTGIWYVQGSTRGFFAVAFGLNGDVPQVGDFDGDGKADISVYRPATGVWYRLNSSNNQFLASSFGAAGDIPDSADFDGDGKTDLAIFRPANGIWYLQQSSVGFSALQFGQAGDRPAAADYDGDRKSDLAVFRPASGTWYVRRSTGGISIVQFGLSGDVPIESAFVP